MKFFLNFFDNVSNRPSYKFFLNLFFFKNNQYYCLKQLNYIHIFYNIRGYFQIKTFKFNYTYYGNFILILLLLNIVLQLLIFIFI